MSDSAAEGWAPAATRLGFLAGLLHLPFFVWLLLGDVALPGTGATASPAPSAAPLGDLRSYAALAALLLLAWSRRPTAWAAPTGARATRAAFVFAAAALLAAIGVGTPVAWAASLPLLGAGIAMVAAPADGDAREPNIGLRRYAVLVLLAAAVFPFERQLGPSLSPFLQLLTAHCAAPLVSVTGLPVHVDAAGDPIIVGENLYVTVTALCAGSQTILTLLTLGMIIAEVFLKAWDVKLAFVALTPLFGFAGNVLRVAVSTHAATRWGRSGGGWDLAHDLIGYAAFALTYVALFVVARRLRRLPRRQPTSASLGAER